MEIDRRINEGVADVLLRTGCKVTTSTIAEVAGTGDYTLDVAILRVVALYCTSASSSTNISNPTRVGVQELLKMRNATSSIASPATVYAVAGGNLLMVYPTPSAADTITLYYVPVPATLSVSSDSPSEIQLVHHPAVEMYALWRLADLDDDQTSAQGQRYKDLYEEWIGRIRHYIHHKGGPLPTARVGRRRINGYANQSPSTDVGYW